MSNKAKTFNPVGVAVTVLVLVFCASRSVRLRTKKFLYNIVKYLIYCRWNDKNSANYYREKRPY